MKKWLVVTQCNRTEETVYRMEHTNYAVAEEDYKKQQNMESLGFTAYIASMKQ
jgi:hypothetical protein